MLKFKNFKITDDTGINDHLSKFIIAKDSSVFMSNGEMLIPYEDGELPNEDQRVLLIKEEMNTMDKQIEIMLHSQRVLEIQLEGANKELETLKSEIIVTPSGKEDYDSNKEKDSVIKKVQNVIDQTGNQILMNQAELTRMVTNIKVYNERIGGSTSSSK